MVQRYSFILYVPKNDEMIFWNYTFFNTNTACYAII